MLTVELSAFLGLLLVLDDCASAVLRDSTVLVEAYSFFGWFRCFLTGLLSELAGSSSSFRLGG